MAGPQAAWSRGLGGWGWGWGLTPSWGEMGGRGSAGTKHFEMPPLHHCQHCPLAAGGLAPPRRGSGPQPWPGQTHHLKMDRRLLSLPAVLCLPQFQMSRLGTRELTHGGQEGGDKGGEHGSLHPEGSFPDPEIPPSRGPVTFWAVAALGLSLFPCPSSSSTRPGASFRRES